MKLKTQNVATNMGRLSKKKCQKYYDYVQHKINGGTTSMPMITTELYRRFPETKKIICGTLSKSEFYRIIGFNLSNNHMIQRVVKIPDQTSACSLTCQLNKPLLNATMESEESKELEYKLGFDSCSITKQCETIAALANVGGGRLVWGVRDNDLRVTGVPRNPSAWDQHRRNIVNCLKNKMAPSVPKLHFDTQVLTADRSLYWVSVDNSTNQQYSIDDCVWERRGPSNHVKTITSPWIARKHAVSLSQHIRQLETKLQHWRVLQSISSIHTKSMEHKLQEAEKQNHMLAMVLRKTIAHYESKQAFRSTSY